MVDKMDLALLKQEIVDWHGRANEACDLLRNHADATIKLPNCLPDIEFKTNEEQRAFRLGVVLACSQFGTLPFEVESDEESDNE
ncbi:hypothetical protein V8167_002936 [Providencia rettgeri]|uniref:hypothetical protein n=1 Tax=Providencia sp. PROV039 TaxID=2949770 RepID=UPI00234B0D83|nr:hypothetical protein [Providencia sp. PROV039]MBZ3683118.1 hypothetical protein [Providencia rettgeri]